MSLKNGKIYEPLEISTGADLKGRFICIQFSRRFSQKIRKLEGLVIPRE